MRGLPLTSETERSFSGRWISNITPRIVFLVRARLVT
jgi:hypothetical protein